MKWIGQHIVDIIARFKSDVYLENLSTTTDADVLVVDPVGKVGKKQLEEFKHDLVTHKGICQIGSAFFSSSTAAFYVPFNYIGETTSLSASSYAWMVSAPYSGKVIKVSSFTQNAASKTTTVEMYLNGDDSPLTDQVGTDLVISSYTVKNTGTPASDWVFSAGDSIAFRVTNSAVGYGQTMSFVFEYDLTT